MLSTVSRLGAAVVRALRSNETEVLPPCRQCVDCWCRMSTHPVIPVAVGPGVHAEAGRSDYRGRRWGVANRVPGAERIYTWLYHSAGGVYRSSERPALVPRIVRLGCDYTVQIIDEESDSEDGGGRITFFDRAAYSSGLTIEGNILFGSVAHGRPDAPEEVGAVVDTIMDDLGLRQAVVQAALEIPSGIGGGRLSPTVRQKIALARAVLKQPRLLIIDEALTALDGASRARLLANLDGLFPEGTILWIDSELPPDMTFDRVINVRAGRVEDIEAEPTERAEAAPGEAEAEIEADSLAAMAARLMRVPMLAGLDHSQLKLLAFTSDTLTYDIGERIIQQGDTGDCAFVITSGEAKILLERDGEERFIRTCGENEILGELALLNDIPRTASIEAVTELTVLRMSKDVFLELLKANNHAAHAVMREIAQRLASMT